MATNDDKDIAESNGLSWSDSEYELSEFLDIFPLPQLVQVSNGVYGVSDESTLPSGQTLTLHVIKETMMFRGYTYEGQDILVPLNCPQKVEVRPQDVSLEYDTVEELRSVFIDGRVKYVRVTKDYVHPSGAPERCLQAGQKLKLEYLSTENIEPSMMCLDVEDGCEVCLSMNALGGFQPLADNREYFLGELTQHFVLPVYIQFTSPPSFTNVENSRVKGDNERLLSGIFQVDELLTESMVIASTRAPGGRKTILTFPRSLKVDLMVPEQLLTNDSTYARVCDILNDGIDLVMAESLTVPDNKIIYGTREQIVREFSYSEDEKPNNVGEGSRCRENVNTAQQTPVQDVGIETDSDSDSDAYEEIDDKMSSIPHHYQYIDPEDHMNCAPVKLDHTKLPPRPKTTASSKIPSPAEKKCSLGRSVKSFISRNVLRSKEEKQPPGPDTTPGSLKSKDRSTHDTEDDSYGYCIPDRKSEHDIQNMSIAEVTKFLHTLNLGEYAERFEREQVDGKILHDLKKPMLINDFHMKDFHAHKLQRVISGTWWPNVG